MIETVSHVPVSHVGSVERFRLFRLDEKNMLNVPELTEKYEPIFIALIFSKLSCRIAGFSLTFPHNHGVKSKTKTWVHTA